VERTIDRSFERSAEKRSREPFLFFEGKTIRYGPFRERVDALAAGFAGTGLGPGDRVALALGNSPVFIETAFALLRLGATLVPLNHFLTPPEVRTLIARAQVSAIVAEREMLRLVVDAPRPPKGRFLVGEGAEEGWTPLESLRRSAPLPGEIPRPAPETVALLLYTSGTDGEPRGVLLTHANITANTRQCVGALGPNEKDRFLLFLPLFHTFTLTVCLFLPASIGAGIVLARSARNFPAILRDVIRRRVTIFVAVPAVYNALARRRLPFILRRLNRIRFMVSGSAPLSPQAIAAIEEKLRAPLLEGYGLTEAGPVVSVSRAKRRIAGTVGPPLPGVEVRIVDENGRERMPGEVGELLVRGENVASAFLGEACPVRDGWLHTGDLVSADTDGTLTIHDRKRDLILVRGINVYPREIEEAIAELPGVAAVAVVRARSEKKGEVPRAFVVPAEGMHPTPAAILGHLRGRLAPYKIPASIEIVPDLPRTGTGKVLRRVLEERPLPSPADPGRS
jgi:long-chain acyl-CoA synthetase